MTLSEEQGDLLQREADLIARYLVGRAPGAELTRRYADAILGVGRAEQQAVPVDGGFQSCLIMPLSISYDHRLIDGADAARFLRWVAEALEQPLLLLMNESDG